MKSNSIKSRFLLVILAIVLPPVGIILLWAHSRASFLAKSVGSIFLIGLSIFYLFTFFGLQTEMAGSGFIPIITFRSGENHYSELEEQRNEQQKSLRDSVVVKRVNEDLSSITNETEEDSLDLLPEGTAEPAPVDPYLEKRYWTLFRGPNMDGHYQQTEILTDWPDEGLPLLWKQPIGGGYASFVIADGLAFTIEQRRNLEVVAAYQLETGGEVWTHSWKAEFKESMGGDGPRATPTWHDGRIYALGATGEFKVLQAGTGDLIWEINILDDNRADNLPWGMAASPLIVDEKVIVQPGGPQGNSVVAYHNLTGEPIWRSLDDPQAYTSPLLVELAGIRQILTVTRERAVGLNPEDGTLLWEYPWVTSYGANAALPIILDENRFFISAGYSHGAAVVEVIPNISGSGIRFHQANIPSHDRNLNRQTAPGFSVREIWQNIRMKNRFSASVLHDGYIYGLDEAIFACIDPENGKRMWKGGRYGNGEVLLASGHLIVLTEKGELALVEATPESHKELARFKAIRGKTWNNHALAEGILLVRNAYEMAAFRIGRDL